MFRRFTSLPWVATITSLEYVGPVCSEGKNKGLSMAFLACKVMTPTLPKKNDTGRNMCLMDMCDEHCENSTSMSFTPLLFFLQGLNAIILRGVRHGALKVGGLAPSLWRCIHRLPMTDIWEDYIMESVCRVGLEVLIFSYIRKRITNLDLDGRMTVFCRDVDVYVN